MASGDSASGGHQKERVLWKTVCDRVVRNQYKDDIRHIVVTGGQAIQVQKALLLAMLLTIVAAAAFVGIRVWTRPTGETNTSKYPEVEDYNGTKLSSISDFHENSINGPQYIDNGTYRLTVTGLVENETVYTYDDVVNNHAHYQKVATLHCVEGWEVTVLWEGVRVKDLLEETGYDQTAKVLIFYAQDGYTTSLPLSYIVNNNIMIAYKMNGVVLPPERGFPFQLVAEGKYGYKWIKWITKIEISNDINFRGTWESNGYDNNADYP